MTLQTKAPKPKTCEICKTKFAPRLMAAKVCSPMCGLTKARQDREKEQKLAVIKDKRETKAKLDALRKKPQLVALAQKAFNSFVRARDAGKPCISCGTALAHEAVGGAFDCGHYRSVGSAVHMRFVEDNAAGQCKHCNRHLAGNHVAYRIGLIERIGQHNVDFIERDQTLRKYTHEGLIELARHYNAEAKRIKGQA